MSDMSNFSKERELREERTKLIRLKKEKQADFYHAIAKICFTALVVGIVVAAVQNTEAVGILHYLVVILGLTLTYAAYMFGNNKLK